MRLLKHFFLLRGTLHTGEDWERWRSCPCDGGARHGMELSSSDGRRCPPPPRHEQHLSIPPSRSFLSILLHLPSSSDDIISCSFFECVCWVCVCWVHIADCNMLRIVLLPKTISSSHSPLPKLSVSSAQQTVSPCEAFDQQLEFWRSIQN